MTARLGVVLWVVLLWPAAALHARVLDHSDPPPALSQVVARTMPAVVLLLAHQNDGTIRYGAGLVVDDHGGVLTSLHVVRGATRLQALLHRGDGTTYTPMDGGLSRLLFERARDLVAVTLEDQDVLADLARVRLAADTRSIARIPVATTAALPGETVLAVGHPQENVWSFTSGVVGAIRQGAIQHDALLSPGNSGGPLLNLRGEVVGINVSRIVSDAWGVSFARPLQRAAWLVPGLAVDDAWSGATLAQTVERCRAARAQASGTLVRCVDWEGAQRALDDAGGAPGVGPRWVAAEQQRLLALLAAHRRGQPAAGAGRGWCRINPEGPQAGAPGVLEPLGLDAGPLAAGEAWWMAPGAQGPARVEAVSLDPGGNGAWVRLLLRDAQGDHAVVERWVLRASSGWVQRVVPLAADVATLPEAWPLPATSVAVLREALARQPAGGGSTPPRTPSHQ